MSSSSLCAHTMVPSHDRQVSDDAPCADTMEPSHQQNVWTCCHGFLASVSSTATPLFPAANSCHAALATIAVSSLL
ncbi:hypothetical protein MRB53_012813 [Persea americana]|uniref:Uncharacterized protein n=1 Tax=Persea americana TaxID=3435 RepID=A0ACC2LYD6_PERAE|nr:hypothetical protein MRB53_012813 [Persea americana]